jgi:hypothetical protein
MAKFGCSIDELKVDGFQIFSGSRYNDGFSQKNESLLGSNTASFKNNEVIIDNTIVRESTQRSNVLFGDIGVSGSIVLGSTSCSLSDSVNLFV